MQALRLIVARARSAGHRLRRALLAALRTENDRRELERHIDARLHGLLDNLPALVGRFDRDGICRFANQRALAMYGLRLEDIVGRRPRDVLSEADYEQLERNLPEVLTGRRVDYQGTGLLDGRSVDYLTRMVPDIAPDGSVVGFLVMTFDVSSLRMAEREMARLASSDPLTRLPNRRYLDEQLPQVLGRASRRGVGGSGVLFLDADRFKHVNDAHGHAAGDRVLQEIAARVTQSIRHVDFVARIAGDEFVVVVEGLESEADLDIVAAKIVAAMAPPVAFAGTALSISVSIGGVFLPADAAASSHELLEMADKALYEAKLSGRGTHAVRRFEATA